MEPNGFRSDVERTPDTLALLADAIETGSLPLDDVPTDVDRILLLGMGSSMYAAGVAAARMRSVGLDAVAELASSSLLPSPSRRTLVVAVSATGGSTETVDAVARYSGRGPVVAVTEQPRPSCRLTIRTAAPVPSSVRAPRHRLRCAVP